MYTYIHARMCRHIYVCVYMHTYVHTTHIHTLKERTLLEVKLFQGCLEYPFSKLGFICFNAGDGSIFTRQCPGDETEVYVQAAFHCQGGPTAP